VKLSPKLKVLGTALEPRFVALHTKEYGLLEGAV